MSSLGFIPIHLVGETSQHTLLPVTKYIQTAGYHIEIYLLLSLASDTPGRVHVGRNVFCLFEVSTCYRSPVKAVWCFVV